MKKFTSIMMHILFGLVAAPFAWIIVVMLGWIFHIGGRISLDYYFANILGNVRFFSVLLLVSFLISLTLSLLAYRHGNKRRFVTLIVQIVGVFVVGWIVVGWIISGYSSTGVSIGHEKALNVKAGISNYIQLNSVGLEEPTTWLVLRGKMPPGMYLDVSPITCMPSAGFSPCSHEIYAVVSGVPTKPGTYTFTVLATDWFKVGTRTYTVEVTNSVKLPKGGMRFIVNDTY